MEKQFSITTLAELTIYLPLFCRNKLYDRVDRIGADIIRREYYLLEKYEEVVKSIPDIPAKRYAKYLVTDLRLHGRSILNREDEELKRTHEIYKKGPDFPKGYDQYFDLLTRKVHFNKKDHIIEAEREYFPELFE